MPVSKTEANRWWENNCPICGNDVQATSSGTASDDGTRYCEDCKYRWNTELPEHEVIVLARDYFIESRQHEVEQGGKPDG